MRFIICSLCVLLLISCNNKQGKNLERIHSDSIEIARQMENSKLKKLREDSLSVIAWGDLRFGMSKEDALQTVSLKNGDIDNNTISMNFETRFYLEQAFGLKEFRTFDVIFEENELSFITIRSANVSASHIDDLVNDCKIFAKNFEKKIGEPVMSIGEEVNVFSFNEGKNFTFAQYGIGDKCIVISLGETYSGSEYFYKIDINNWQYPKKKRNNTREEEAGHDNEQKRKQDIIDNSF